MTIAEFERNLEKYAEVIVKVGLNIQPGQRLLIGSSRFGRVTPFEAEPLVRHIAAQAYQAGVRLVDVIWGDPQLDVIRLQHAPQDSLEEFPDWRVAGSVGYAERGDALLNILGHDPDLFAGQDSELVSALQRVSSEKNEDFGKLISRSATNWLLVTVPTPGWAAKVFPDLPPDEQQARLWTAIFAACRVDLDDPVAAWQQHKAKLAARRAYLTQKGYSALNLRGPGTDLTIGLPTGHIWGGGGSVSENNIAFTPNMPTEEVYSMPHRERVAGTVRATMPLSYGGALIEDFSLTFEAGRVVDISAKQGETVLRKMIETDEGAARLGEVALVPHSSPISQSGILFYNTLYDENASNHIALGRAYSTSLEGGRDLSAEQFQAAGGNTSLIHVDFMIGSGAMDVDGTTAEGGIEPVMRAGEWAFEVS